MKMLKVSAEIFDQMRRECESDKDYITKVLKQVDTENPEIAKMITNNVRLADMFFMPNLMAGSMILTVTLLIYKALATQMEVNELEEQAKIDSQ